jgi:hypothetical protein
MPFLRPMYTFSVSIIDNEKEDHVVHKLKNCTFTDLLTPENSRIVIKDAEQMKFTNVRSITGARPQYDVTESTAIAY